MTTHVEVYSVIEGALDETRDLSPELADGYAEHLAEELRGAAELHGFEDWAVFMVPHSCGGISSADGYADGGTSYLDAELECVCAQYLTDHHPAFSSNDETRETE
jgi:hypothetical protein